MGRLAAGENLGMRPNPGAETFKTVQWLLAEA